MMTRKTNRHIPRRQTIEPLVMHADRWYEPEPANRLFRNIDNPLDTVAFDTPFGYTLRETARIGHCAGCGAYAYVNHTGDRCPSCHTPMAPPAAWHEHWTDTAGQAARAGETPFGAHMLAPDEPSRRSSP